MVKGNVKEALQIIKKEFDLASNELPVKSNPSIQELHKYLTIAIGSMLDREFNKLLNLLYRVDIEESLVAEALHAEKPSEVASELAWLVIDREMKKVESRKKYSTGHS